jgi:outer membrane protein TolC
MTAARTPPRQHPTAPLASAHVARAAGLAVALTLLQASPARAQPAAPLRLVDALAHSLERGHEVRAASLGVEAAATRVDGARAQRYPRLRAEANLLYWDSALELAFGAPGMGAGMPGAMPGTMPAATGMTAGASKLLVRDQITSNIQLTIAQPLSGLLVLQRLVALEAAGVSAARADAAKARLDTAHRVAEAYLRLLQARAFAAVASKSLEQVQAQLARAQVFEKAGALERVDVLRLQAALAQARQGALRAEAGAQVARQGLALAIGLSAGESTFEVVDDLPDPPPPPRALSDEALRAAASRGRPELTGLRERIVQADLGRGVALSQLLPNVMAIGTFQHAEGAGPFQPKNAWFVGATLQWDIWDWGKSWKAVKEAEARAAQARVGALALTEQIAFDARRRLIDVTTAHESLEATAAAITAAEEAFRLQTVRWNGGAATTTDVLDAEADVTRARNGRAQARFDYFLAQAALARALGEAPAFSPGGSDARK